MHSTGTLHGGKSTPEDRALLAQLKAREGAKHSTHKAQQIPWAETRPPQNISLF
ncbi:MAG: hypothetical protein ACP5II_00385 [Infirmifilum sp.]|uniref:hypothetical protein n=1 Tax=Infirmifilum sp. TaxID=2856575 RepID=UPI003D109492